MPDSTLFIGLMSGTSIDAIDAVLVDFGTPTPRIRHHTELPIPDSVRSEILTLTQPGDDHIDRMGRCDQMLGELFTEAANQLLREAQVASMDIAAIGSHGQTIRHRPPQRGESKPFTLQIGDPNVIAAKTGITTVADFRRRDMALGGQGAPLVPAFHKAAFADQTIDRAILNLGGIANVTWLPANGNASGFDTGPANVLMDEWCQQNQGQPYDMNGEWAASGTVQLELLKRLLSHPFLSQSTPKSTGREDFNGKWLQRILEAMERRFEPQDIQATLLEFTARSAADAIRQCGSPTEVYLCGGGALNKQLAARLQALLSPAKVMSTAELGIDPKRVEGVAFAWLAKQTLTRLPGNMPAVTGASEEAILGGIYFA
ncbi:anhydro-N-acetylmuramic acid kinase [Porticoccaceae bacterium LTM1]|nr:anhydro-N-acetylmuramic acid kinase [Porticoccaceae bacterium LTM1]